MMGESKIRSLGSMVGQSGGIKGGRACSFDTLKENTVNYAGINAQNFAGISDYDVLDGTNGLATTKQISLTPYGDVECIANGAVDPGVYVYVASADGKIGALPATPGTYYVIGMSVNAAALDLDRFIVRLAVVPFPVTIS